MADLTYKYKTKKEGTRLMMICSNSNPETSKYPQAAPEEGVCDQWCGASENTAQVLCSSCVSRLMLGMGAIHKEYHD